MLGMRTILMIMLLFHPTLIIEENNKLIWEIDEYEPKHAEKVADACNNQEKLESLQGITYI